MALTARDRHHLEELGGRARAHGLRAVAFREPDLGDELTALAFVPHEQNRPFLRKLPLAGSTAGSVDKHKGAAVLQKENDR